MRTGIAKLPLHSGRAPAWLLEKMSRLSGLVIELIIREHGLNTFLDKISDPFWFQALGNFLGFDWHSSGLTTTLCAAMKKGLRMREKELGVFIAGGKGKFGISTPQEIERYAQEYGFNPYFFIYASRMSAKVDNNCLQDGYSIYQHTIIFTPSGEWSVIQQGMNPGVGYARRYHWRGNLNKDFVATPQSGIICPKKGFTIDLTANKSGPTREIISKLVLDKPEKNLKRYRKVKELKFGEKFNYRVNMDLRRFEKILIKIRENNPSRFVDVVEISGVGSQTLRALTLLAHLIYGAEPSFKDPAVYSYAHGGKDGIPYPVEKKEYSQTIKFLNKFLNKSNPENRLDLKEFLKITLE